MFDPRILFLVIWGSQIAGYVLGGDQFFPFDARTWLVFMVGVSGYFVGSALALSDPIRPAHPARALHTIARDELRFVRRFFVVAQLAYVAACVLAVVQITGVLGVDALLNGDLVGLRLAVINDFLGDRELFLSIRVFYFGVGLCLFQLAYARYLRRLEMLVVMLLGLVSAIATTGRLYLLLYVMACAYLLYRQRLATRRAVGMLFALFVVLFLLIAVLFGKGADEGSMLDQIVWNLRVYLLSSLACFNDYVVTGSQETAGGLLIPNALRAALRVVGVAMADKPNLLPFATVPLQCNTYTVLFPLYHDTGFVGVFVGLAAIGLLNTYLWLRQRISPSPVMLFAYATVLYPLTMSMFEDAYFSSPGFWLMLWAPPFILSVLLGIRRVATRVRRPACHRTVDFKTGQARQ